ncbi:MAG: hypothetical protein WC205_03360 [Opitutaceae bacterium]|jgi:hypothetical protein
MSTRPIQSPSDVPDPIGLPPLREVRYSLPELLAELQSERTTGAFSQEKLHQIEIGKLFKNRKKRRGQTPA